MPTSSISTSDGVSTVNENVYLKIHKDNTTNLPSTLQGKVVRCNPGFNSSISIFYPLNTLNKSIGSGTSTADGSSTVLMNKWRIPTLLINQNVG